MHWCFVCGIQTGYRCYTQLVRVVKWGITSWGGFMLQKKQAFTLSYPRASTVYQPNSRTSSQKICNLCPIAKRLEITPQVLCSDWLSTLDCQRVNLHTLTYQPLNCLIFFINMRLVSQPGTKWSNAPTATLSIFKFWNSYAGRHIRKFLVAEY